MPNVKSIGIITDCGDSNARSRQILRCEQLFEITPSFAPLSSAHPNLEGLGNLLDHVGR